MKRTIYQARIWIWLGVLLCMLLYKGITILIEEVGKVIPEAYVYIDVHDNTDIDMLENVANVPMQNWDIKVTTNKEDAPVIFSDADSYTGYTKYEGYLSSPLVLYVGNGCTSTKDSFFIKLGDTSSDPVKCDLYTLLKAVEEEQEWQDIGVPKEVAKGIVTLTIPNERCYYYTKIVDLFYLTLNGGMTVTDEDKDRLEDEVNRILLKCNKVIDISAEMNSDYKESANKATKVFIGPEYLWFRKNQNYIETQYTGQFRPVYPHKTVAISLNMFIKEDNQFANDFLQSIINKTSFSVETGYRVKNRRYDMKSMSDELYNPVIVY